MNIAIIPARGGSKRLPNKNIKLISGKPLIEWTIIAAINSQIFDEIHVNTDCNKIAKVSLSAGAKIPFIRSKNLATDFSSSRDVILDHYSFIESNYHKIPNSICVLQPTSPIRDNNDIISSYNILKDKNANSVVSVCELDHPIELANKLDANKSMHNFLDQSKIKRSQDYKKNYRINGAIYILDSSLKGDLNNLYNRGTYPYIMPIQKSIDIDSEYDYHLAEFFLNMNK